MSEVLSSKRRTFLASTIATGAGLTILPSGTMAAKGPGGKLNIALIGAYGRAKQHYRDLKTQNVVAICDINAENLAIAAKEFPQAKQYKDWRICLEQKNLDAVVCCTPDHHHAFVTIWAMNRGLHVYCEKPVADCVAEAREVRKVYLANKHRLATQHGTQRHEWENFDRVAELVKGGAIGDIQDVHTWGNRTHPLKDYYPAEGTPPPHIDYDLWTGPTQMHPYSPQYFSGRPGANCLQWNPFDDFGSWQVGDMGSHTMDLAWNAIDADRPTKIVVDKKKSDPYNPGACPSALMAIFDMPANDWRGPIRLTWSQGGPMPNSPVKALDLTKIGHGAMFKGTKGVIVADFKTRMIFPAAKGADMTYYKSPTPDQVAPPINGWMQQWFDACKGDLKTAADFDYSARMIETLMLGLVAHRAGKPLNYDAKSGRITNDEAANSFLHKPYRKGWKLNG
ncbi:MAG: Gfo/Idh/MocA family oxidoreductase [Kiritimatiellales bacterium]|nr:Gfo/Idh/MocA family oxidoreductase [Kiritimatiellales bacterium]